MWGWLLLGLPLSLLHATAAPAPEHLEWHGKVYDLMTQPLEQRYTEAQVRPRFMRAPLQSPRDDRGYVGSWRLEDDRLYLLAVDSWLCRDGATRTSDCRKATLHDVLGEDATTPLFAEWFNGELILASPETASAVSMKYGTARGRTIHITLKAGKVTHIQTLDRDR